MALSKKHYEQFAQRFAQVLDALPTLSDGKATPREIELQRSALCQMAMKLSIDFALDNPRFDRHRFLVACGF